MLFLLGVMILQNTAPEDLIEKLGSDKVEVRDAAFKDLRRLGEAARPQLKKAASSSDQELSARARKLLEALDSDSAERSYHQIEDTLLHAKTARIKFTGQGKTATGGRLEEKGTLLLKEGGKVHLAATTLAGKEKYELLVTSDGRITAAIVMGWPVDAPEGEGHILGDHAFPNALPELRAEMARGLVRLGQADASKQLRKWVGFDGKQAVNLGAGASFGGFRAGPDEGGKKTLSYEIKEELSPDSAREIKLWYDPKTLLISRRVHSVAKGSASEIVLDEVYEEFILDADIPDETFKLDKGR